MGFRRGLQLGETTSSLSCVHGLEFLGSDHVTKSICATRSRASRSARIIAVQSGWGVVSGQRITRAVVSMPIFLAVRFALTLLLAFATALVLSVAPALAAAPEAPEVSIEHPVHSTRATFLGVLNPHTAAGEVGSYKFLYKASTTKECAGGSTTTEGFSFGEKDEPLPPEPVSGLTANTEYAVCLLDKDAGGETPSPVVTFTTPSAPFTDAASAVTTTTATLHGHFTLNGAVASQYSFDYNVGATCTGGEHTTVQEAGTGATTISESVAVSGLLPSGEYTACFVTLNQYGSETGAPVHFTTEPIAATIEPNSETVNNLAATSATLNAKVNPKGAPVTSCRFQYGTSTAYGNTAPCEHPDAVEIERVRNPVPVLGHIEGLSANTEYHWRLLVTNAAGTETSPDQTFIYPVTTEGAGCADESTRVEDRSTALPDCRAYEMITPPHDNGAALGDFFTGPPLDIAADGSRVIINSIQCFAESVSCNAGERQNQGNPFAFSRTSSGWVTMPLAPPATQFQLSVPYMYNADLGTALFLSSSPSGESFVARQPEGSFPERRPRFAEVGPPFEFNEIDYPTATADLSHLIYEPVGEESTHQAYEYVGTGNTAPSLVGVRGGAGSTEVISECLDTVGAGREYGYNALSDDGATAFFTAWGLDNLSSCGKGTAPPVSEVYARIDQSRTVLISGRSPLECTLTCLSSSASDANYEGASEDGSKAFFLSTQQLTNHASAGSGSVREQSSCELPENECNLYEYDFANPTGRNLIDVSAGAATGNPRVQSVFAISPDGSHIYFIAQGVLTSSANARGQVAHEGKENLYVFERDSSFPDGHVAFIATLPTAAEEPPEFGLRARVFPLTNANVTPDGRFLVFESQGQLTSDDSDTASAKQVFRYDAQTGALLRLSIGEAGFNDNGNAARHDAHIAPMFKRTFRAGPVRTNPTMSNDGSYVFFESPAALTAGALNEVTTEGGALAQNIYEWHEGQVSLISDGRDVTEYGNNACQRSNRSDVCLLGTDATGADVFFSSSDQIVPEDTWDQQEVFDARICTSSEPCHRPATQSTPCAGEACHPSPAGAPALPASSSATFTGPGNLAPPPPPPGPKAKSAAQVRAEKLAKALNACRRDKKKKKRRGCEEAAHKAYGAKAGAKRASRKAHR
jgi:hypothetical protein